MKLIVCLDDGDGMLFLGKRQSKDSLLRRRILQLTEGCRLWMNGYSARQFTEEGAQLFVDEEFWNKAEPEDYCFVENADLTACLPHVHQLILYRWNRLYPSDIKFPMDRLKGGLSLERTFDFAGSSHERITEEVYHYEDQAQQ